MKKTEISKTVTTMVLAILMIASTFIVFSNTTVPMAKAAIPSNLLQYEWIQPGVDASHSNAVNSPGPTTPHIEWRTKIPNVAGQPVAFNGKIFVTDTSLYGALPGKNTTLYCLDAATGEIIYTLDLGPNPFAAVPGSHSVCKLDNTYMLIGSKCYKIADGSLVWTGPSGFSYDQTIYSGMGYDSNLKTLISGSKCWSLADPSQPPELLWDRASEPDYNTYGSESPKCYGSGVVVYTTGFYYLRGVDVTTGKTIWTTPTNVTSWSYGAVCIDGVFGYGALTGNFYGWNLTTGQLMWIYDPGTFYNQWASGPGAAYGMFYEHNEDAYVYAINATTGELVWKYKGPGIAYSNSLTIAGGKVYINSGENQYVDFDTGEFGHSEFACLDAYTGEVIWTMPIENGAPFNLQCNAYGKLFVVPTISSSKYGIFTYTAFGESLTGPGELWCIGDTPLDYPMLMGDPAHSSFGEGPATLKLKWKATTGGTLDSSPTLVDGVAYVGSYDGKIYAFDANTGTKMWTYDTGILGFSSTVAVVNNRLYTGAQDGNVYCLNANTGTKLWEANAGGVPSSGSGAIGVSGEAAGSPTVTGGMVYVAAGDTNVYCFDADTGTKIWNHTTGAAISGQTPAVVDGAVYLGAGVPDGVGPNVIKLNATTGAEIFNADFPGYFGGFSLNPFSISASVTVGGGMVFARGTYRHNVALNATTGELIWLALSGYNEGSPFQSNGAAQLPAMLYANGLVYISDYYSISALDALNGSKVWSTYTSRESLSQGFSYSFGKIYTTNEAGTLYVLDAFTGEKLSSYQFDVLTLHSVPTPYNGSLYVSNMEWDLYCFEEAPPQQFHGAVPSSISVMVSPKIQLWGEEVLFEGTTNPGLPVQITAIDPNTNFQDIANVTSDETGFFTAMWAPPVPGLYVVTASCLGDQSYSPSSAKTAFIVSEEKTAAQPMEPEPIAPASAPAEPTPTEPQPTEPEPEEPEPIELSSTEPISTATESTEAFALGTTETAIIAAVAVAVVIGIAAYWTLKKRK